MHYEVDSTFYFLQLKWLSVDMDERVDVPTTAEMNRVRANSDRYY